MHILESTLFTPVNPSMTYVRGQQALSVMDQIVNISDFEAQIVSKKSFNFAPAAWEEPKNYGNEWAWLQANKAWHAKADFCLITMQRAKQ